MTIEEFAKKVAAACGMALRREVDAANLLKYIKGRIRVFEREQADAEPSYLDGHREDYRHLQRDEPDFTARDARILDARDIGVGGDAPGEIDIDED